MSLTPETDPLLDRETAMSVVMSNSVQAVEPPNDVPVRPDGVPFRFEMLFDGMTRRAYADTADDLLAFLVRDYAAMSAEQRLVARMHLAARSQVSVQAEVNASADLGALSDAERAVLTHHRAVPVELEVWASAVPLILLDTHYAPFTAVPAPLSAIADVNEPPNLYWLRPVDPYDLLLSLHQVGVLCLNQHATAT